MSREQDSCTHKILLGLLDKIDNICGIKLLRVLKTMLIETENSSKYLTVTTKKNYGSLVLEDTVKLLEFAGTQLLTINQKGNLRLGHLDIKFLGENTKVKTQLSKQSKWNLTLSSYVLPESLQVPEVRTNVIMKAKELNDLAENIMDLKSNTENLNNESSKTFWIIFSILSCSIAFIVIIFLTIFFFNQRLNKLVQPRPQPRSNVKQRQPLIRNNIRSTMPSLGTARGRAII